MAPPRLGDKRDTWRVSLVANEIADNSDKTIIVPVDTEYEVLSLWVELTTSSDVGARQLEIQFQDSEGDVICVRKAGITQAASLTYNYLIAPGVVSSLAVLDSDLVDVNMPLLVLSPGQKIRVFDNNAVAAAADDMIVQMQIASRSVA